MQQLLRVKGFFQNKHMYLIQSIFCLPYPH
jgi:hypothetical protein